MSGERSADGYLAFLIARDGEPDFARHTLSRREAFFERLARDPVRSRLPIDRAAYLRNLARRRPERGLDDSTLWLAHRVAGGLLEFRALFGRRELARRFGAAFRLDEMVAELPGRAYAPALI